MSQSQQERIIDARIQASEACRPAEQKSWPEFRCTCGADLSGAYGSRDTAMDLGRKLGGVFLKTATGEVVYRCGPNCVRTERLQCRDHCTQPPEPLEVPVTVARPTVETEPAKKRAHVQCPRCNHAATLYQSKQVDGTFTPLLAPYLVMAGWHHSPAGEWFCSALCLGTPLAIDNHKRQPVTPVLRSSHSNAIEAFRKRDAAAPNGLAGREVGPVPAPKATKR